ncbi:uncharacterized protein LOC131681252 [Topomyia yanbarensis]|uniref:uncharacterized protein LOC131681252 n=1 Tax=Topomyia yanbarensis TaxID=2498891 RepID=UPI00273BE72F|nr:uncharacterized protein LOC131681252 [Topomyia yanbarensis]XP_058817946.1 uncharacterized protein LOC131681252 [Topomyia yanbarensis]
MDTVVPEPAMPPSPAAALSARREARRKRILENSNNRLTKITGREHNESTAEDFTVKPPDVIYPDPEDERDVYQQPEISPFLQDAGFPSADGDIFSLLSTLQQVQSNGGIAGGGPVHYGESTNVPPVPESKLVRFLRTKIHIALTGIAVYLLFAADQQHLIGGNVFILLLGWEFGEVFLLKSHEPKSSFLDIVFLLGGISNKYSRIILKFAQTVNRVMKDVAFFVFFFVLTHLVWSRLVLGIEFNYVLGYDRLESDEKLLSS